MSSPLYMMTENNGHYKKVDLKLALAWLEEINTVKTSDGERVYDLFLQGEKSLWMGVQHYLFESLKSLTKEVGVKSYGRQVIERREKSHLRFIADWFHKMNLLVWKVCASVRPKKLLVYTTDIIDPRLRCDFRFERIYRYLQSDKLPFYEIFHTTHLVRTIKNLARLRRPCIYIESFRYKLQSPIRDIHFQDKGLDPVLRRWWKQNYRHFFQLIQLQKRRIHDLSKLLYKYKIRVLLCMDDFRSVPPLLLACMGAGVKTIIVQHGLLSRYHAGWNNPGIPQRRLFSPDKFIVHAPYWKSVLDKYCPHLSQRAVITSGWTDYLKPVKKKPSKSTVNILVIYEALWPDHHEVRLFMSRLLRDGDYKIFFKTRPDENGDEQIEAYFGAKPRRDINVVERLGNVDMGVFDVIVGSHSSLIYQLLVTKIPVIRMMTSYAFGEQLTTDGLTVPWFIETNFSEVLEQAFSLSEEELDRRRRVFSGGGRYPNYEEIIKSVVEGAEV